MQEPLLDVDLLCTVTDQSALPSSVSTLLKKEETWRLCTSQGNVVGLLRFWRRQQPQPKSEEWEVYSYNQVDPVKQQSFRPEMEFYRDIPGQMGLREQIRFIRYEQGEKDGRWMGLIGHNESPFNYFRFVTSHHFELSLEERPRTPAAIPLSGGFYLRPPVTREQLDVLVPLCFEDNAVKSLFQALREHLAGDEDRPVDIRQRAKLEQSLMKQFQLLRDVPLPLPTTDDLVVMHVLLLKPEMSTFLSKITSLARIRWNPLSN